MIPWLLRRVLSALLLVCLLMTAVFFIVRLAPGDPLDQVVGNELTDADRDLMRRKFQLDEPLSRQFLSWAGGVLTGDLGESLGRQQPVAAIIGEVLPPTLLLTVSAYVLQLLLAVAAVGVMVRWRGRAPEHWVQGVGLVFYSLPAFWLGLMAIMLMSRWLGWFPAAGLHATDYPFMSGPDRALDLLRHMFLPVTTLALGTFMGTARYLRAGVEEALGQDYILAARSRGLGRGRILGHALRNALLPIITLVGLHLPFLLGGAVVTEVVFGWPGMGRVTVEAIWARDYPLIMGTTLVAALTVVAGSLLADLLYRWADPRVRPERGMSGS